MELQRSAGNAAVASLFKSGAAPVVQRYESGEHAQTGDTSKTVQINGVRVDEGVLVALGDFYEKPEDIHQAPAEELRNLVTLIERDRRAHQGSRTDAPVTDEEWSEATKNRPKRQQYLELASRNDTHFAPDGARPGAHGDHRQQWRSLHQQALLQVIEANAAGTPGVPDNARVTNGFAAHFLTDAFSAGHLVNKDNMIAKARKKWNAQDFDGLIFKESTFTKAVARRVLAKPEVASVMARKQLKMLVWGEVSPQRFSEFIYQMADSKPELFFNSFAKLVHDRLNRAILGASTEIEVTNQRGDGPWILSGDSTLAASSETLQVMQGAVAQSVLNLEAVSRLRESPSTFDEYFDAVWSFTPHPTGNGANKVDEVVATYTDPTKPETIDAFVELTASQVDLLISELTVQGYMRDKPRRAPEVGSAAPGGGFVPGRMPDGGYMTREGIVIGGYRP